PCEAPQSGRSAWPRQCLFPVRGPMQQFLVFTALGENSPKLIEQISRVVRDCGCSITDSRMAVLGSELALTMMVSGTWDAIAKMEDHLPRLEKELGMAMRWKRTA